MLNTSVKCLCVFVLALVSMSACVEEERIGAAESEVFIPENYVNISPAAFVGAEILNNPMRAVVNTPSRQMWMNLPVPTGKALDTLTINWKGGDANFPGAFEVIQGTAQGVDTFLVIQPFYQQVDFGAYTFKMPDFGHTPTPGDSYTLRVRAENTVSYVYVGTVTITPTK